MTRLSHRLALVIACLLGSAATSQAGNLALYESAVGTGQVRLIPGPVTNALVDIDYAPSTAEGGKVYGMSELTIEATGDLVLTPSGFTCQATSCLYSPAPFVTGKKIRVTAGNDLTGDTAAVRNLLKVGVTGSLGHIVLTRGEYLDGTGPAGGTGSVQEPEVTIFATVPEAERAASLAAAAALLTILSRRRAGRLAA